MKKSILMTLAILGSIILTTSIQSCYTDNEEELYGTTTNAPCDTSAVKFSTTVLPLMTSLCATSGCHNATTASAGANLSTYAGVKSYVTNGKEFFIGSMKHTSGFSAMPKNGSKMAACDVTKIEVWINAGMVNN